MTYAKLAVTALAAGWTSACALTVPAFYPTGQPVPYAVEPAAAPRTTANDPLILRQPFALAPVVRLDEAVRIEPFGAYNNAFEVEAGTLLYGGLLLDTEDEGVGFCSIADNAPSQTVFGDRMAGQSCFYDVGDTGEFAIVYQKGLRPQSVAVPSDIGFQMQFVGRRTLLPEPVSYSAVDELSELRVEMGIRYVAGNGGAARLDVVHLDGPFQRELTERGPEIPPQSDLPAIVQVRSARIELLAHEDGVLTYRVLSGFDPERVTLFDLN